MSIDVFFQLPTFVVAVGFLGAIWFAFQRGWLTPLLTRNELVTVGKLVFIIAAVMLLVSIRNAVILPAGQFIYGRF
jgi:hypothetical protein